MKNSVTEVHLHAEDVQGQHTGLDIRVPYDVSGGRSVVVHGRVEVPGAGPRLSGATHDFFCPAQDHPTKQHMP